MTEESCSTPREWHVAAERTRAAFLHAWNGYERFAFGSDELRPLSHTSSDRWGGLSISMVDAMDTMWLMQLEAPYERARNWLVANYAKKLREGGDAPFFEVTIRALGGLLSAHVLTGDEAMLNLAADVGQRLAPALSQSPSGIPYCTVHLVLGNASCPSSELGESIPLAELGSVQLEFAALQSALSATVPRHSAPSLPDADRALRAVRRLPALYGLYPSRMRPQSGGPASKEVGFGSGTDSFYETLLKRWIQGGKREAWLQAMYRDSLVGLRRLLRRSYPSNLLFLGRANGGEVGTGRPRSHVMRDMHTFEHLTCFVPGMLALGAHHQAGLNATWEWEVARELVRTCSILYERQPARLGPERVAFVTAAAARAAEEERRDGHSWQTEDYDVHDDQWPLRPEYVESLYIMHTLDPLVKQERKHGGDDGDNGAGSAEASSVKSGDGKGDDSKGGDGEGGEGVKGGAGDGVGRTQGVAPSYRALGVRMLEAIERQCRTAHAYCALRSTAEEAPATVAEDHSSNSAPRKAHANSLESFFFAETLKYLYLLFTEPDTLPVSFDLDRFVLTTEAHLLPVRQETEATPKDTNLKINVELEGQGRKFSPWWFDEAMLDEA